MKRMRFILGLSTVLLLVIALALPAAVLAQESATTSEAVTTAGEAAPESPAEEEVDTGPGEADPEDPAIELPDPGPEEPAPEDPVIELPDPGPGEQDPEAPAPPTNEPEAPTIEGLISTVEGLNLQQGVENSLDVKLQNARDSLTAANAGLREDAVNKLQAFINACEAQRDKALTSAQADELIAMANAIILSL